MTDKLNQLKKIIEEVSDLGSTASLLGWDQQTYMPIGGGEARGQQLATIGKLAHQKATSEEFGKLLDELKQEFVGAESSSDDAAMVRVAARDYDKAVRVPAEFVVEQAIVTTKAYEGWAEARSKSDFSIFRPHLEKVVELVRKYINFFPPADHPYDTLLDDYEPGMKTADVQAIFDGLRTKQVELIKAIAARPQVNDKFLHKKYIESKVWDFSAEVTGSSVSIGVAGVWIKPRIRSSLRSA